jgi:DNA-binding beta-propeller fold protein YncE
VLLCAFVPAAIAKRSVYATSAGGLNSVKTFDVAGDGSISPGVSGTTGASPRGIAITPDGARLFAANAGGTTISAFQVDASSGSLTALSAVSDPDGPVALAITPDGSTMFAANPSGSVSAFLIDQFGTAVPAQLGGASLASTGPTALAVSPDGSHLFVAESAVAKLAVFSIGAGGTLTPVGTADTGTGPAGVAITPDGSRVYVANASGDNVSGFSVSPSGALAPLGGSPYGAGDGATGIAIAPDGKRVLVANPSGGSVSEFVIDATTGALANVGTKTSLAGATGVVISPDGTHAYVADGSKAWAFDYGAAGTLTQRGSSYDLSGQGGGTAVTPNRTPSATFEPVPSPATTATHFLGTLATDADGSIASWHWTFGDGTSSNDASPDHTYAQPGSYTVTLTVVDNEGCSIAQVFTGQTASCAGGSSASQSHVIQIPPAPDATPVPPPCQHVGNDGFCGTPDETAPAATILGITDGQSITTLDAPELIVGSIANDPSGIKSVTLRFTKAAGFVTKKTKVRKRVCHKIKGRKKKKCVRKWVTKKVTTSTALCQAASGTKAYLVSYVCSKAPWITISGEAQFRWDVPVSLAIGTYTVEVIATDGAGNADALEQGRNRVTFKIVKTPTNSDTGTGTTTPPTTTTTAPIDDTGSPFGKG